MENILDKAKNHLVQNLPFVIYKKPNKDAIIGLFQKNDTLFLVKNFNEKGFVFASFDGSQTLLIPENESEIISAALSKNKMDIPDFEYFIQDEVAKTNFEDLVAKGIQAIENKEFKKVVLSRKETVELDNFDLIHTFETLVQLYPATFVYCFFHPKVGTWLGATPEQLLKVKGNLFETISLAGTQKNSDAKEVIWEKKEKEEQQFVTDFIVKTLTEVASNVLVSKPYSSKAGSIWHIKTDISGVLNSSSSLKKVIKLLHPTPAVCGLPKDKSKAFILQNENYERSFYTGFLGELNSSFVANSISSNLFVNLRCMQIEVASKRSITKINLFMGCGITKDSIPEKEWEESVNKSMTMKKALNLGFKN